MTTQQDHQSEALTAQADHSPDLATQRTSFKYALAMAACKAAFVLTVIAALIGSGFYTSQRWFQTIVFVEVPAAEFSYTGNTFATMRAPKGAGFWTVAQAANAAFDISLTTTDLEDDNPAYAKSGLPANAPLRVRVATVTECLSTEAALEAQEIIQSHMPPVGGERLRDVVAAMFGQVPSERIQFLPTDYQPD